MSRDPGQRPHLEAVPLGAGVFDPAEAVVHGPTGPVRLTPLEARLLAWLRAHPGRTVPHAELLREVWGYADGVRTRTLYVTVDRLRKKIERDPAQPEHLVARAGVGYRFEPGARGSADLVGRDALLAALAARLDDGAALCLVGPPGVGKSRLLRELAPPARDRGRATVRVDAAAGGGLPAALGRALDVSLGPEAEDQLAFALAASPTALLLDGADALGPTDLTCLAAVRARVPALAVVATARAAPPGFEAIAVPPLPPADAVALLRRRAGVPLADPDADAIAGGAEGLPLALELAAARLRLVGPTALARELGAGDPLGRRGLLGHTWDALPPGARTLLRAAARAGGPLDAALAVALGADLDDLAALVGANLVREHPGDPPRFGVWRVVRALAAEAPPGPGEPDADTLAARIAAAAVRAARPTGGEGPTLDLPEPLAALERLRAAAPWLRAGARAARLAPADAAACGLLLADLASVDGPADAAEPALGALLGAPLADADRARVGLALAEARTAAGRPPPDLDLGELAERDAARLTLLRHRTSGPARVAAAARAEALAEGPVRARLRIELAREALMAGAAADAHAHLDEAALLAPEPGGLGIRVLVTRLRLRTWLRQGHLARASALIDAHLPELEAAGLRAAAADLREMAGFVRSQAGDHEGARAALEAAAAELARQGRLREALVALRSLAAAAIAAGRPADARAPLEAARKGARALGDPAREALATWRLADVERRLGDPAEAERLLDDAFARWPADQFPVERARAELVRGWARLGVDGGAHARAAVAQARALAASRAGQDGLLEVEAGWLAAALSPA